MLRTRVLTAVLSAAVVAVPVVVLARGAGTPQPEARLAAANYGKTLVRQFTSSTDWQAGKREGVAVSGGSLTMSAPAGRTTRGGTSYDLSQWMSTWVQPGFSFTDVIPSWNATTPTGTWLRIQVRARTTAGAETAFKNLGEWTYGDNGFQRTSAGSQADPLAKVSTDTLLAANGQRFAMVQLRVQLMRRSGTTVTPTLRSFGVMVNAHPGSVPPTSTRLLPAKELAVPRYSQMIHRGQYPQFGSGGEAWCSPTSLSMILGYFKRLPTDYGWVDKAYADPWVDHLARLTYDYGYDGTGNWPFNTATAGALVDNAFVTRMGNLTEAERFIAAGIPVEASIAFGSGQLSGAPISSTPGHLVVIVGFTSTGAVIVNDPAAPANSSVRRVYNRAQFERAWLARSHGTAYVLQPAGVALPARGANRNW